MRRTLATFLTPVVRMVEWLFGPRAPGIDLALALFAAGWGAILAANPDIFHRGAVTGLRWLPDAVWVAFFVAVTVMHLLGIVFWYWRNMRAGACLLSAWVWLCVAVSLARVEIVPGVVVYTVIGAMALCGAIYLSGQPRKGG